MRNELLLVLRLAHTLLEQESLDEQQLQHLVKDAHTHAELVSESKANSDSRAAPARP